jgi:glycosyltransferase involved in cell wall biosynthesis
MKVSVVIITRNESHNIGECLASVAFANEIIVVDQSSEDKTGPLPGVVGPM